MKNPFSDWLTRDEQKILGFLAALLVAGMALSHTGVSTVAAAKADTALASLEKATQQDSVIQIDIRTAELNTLILLPGIGEKRAADIIAYRQAKQFESPEELLNIKGIGAKTYLKMKPMLLPFGKAGQGVSSDGKLADLQSVAADSDTSGRGGAKLSLDEISPAKKQENSRSYKKTKTAEYTVHLNTATKQELMSLSGIGEVKAQAILDYRAQIGKFGSVEQLLEVKGIGPKTLEKNKHRLSL